MEILQTPYLLAKCHKISQYTCEKNFNNGLQKRTDYPALTFAILNILTQRCYVRNTQQRYVQISYTEI